MKITWNLVNTHSEMIKIIYLFIMLIIVTVYQVSTFIFCYILFYQNLIALLILLNEHLLCRKQTIRFFRNFSEALLTLRN